MSISKQLTELMNGQIEVSSKKGEGTNFSFNIVLGLLNEQNSCPVPPPVLVQKRILLVVDDVACKRLLPDYLTVYGGQVTCISYADIREQLQRREDVAIPYEVILINEERDAQQSEWLLSRISLHPVYSSKMILTLTYDATQHIARDNPLHTMGWVVKPVRAVDLVKTINRGNIFDKSPAEKPASTQSKTPAIPVDPQRGSFEQVVILLAEDNAVNRTVATITLERFGCIVVQVVNGKEAVAAVESQFFDLILMDCQMPEMDGYEATRIIKHKIDKGEIAPLPIIAMTAHAMIGDREKCIDAGMDDYISKPARKNDIYSCLERWLPAKKKNG